MVKIVEQQKSKIRFFAPREDLLEFLFKLIKSSAVDEARKIISSNSEIIFQTSYSMNLSPFQYALSLLDTRMLKMFLEQQTLTSAIKELMLRQYAEISLLDLDPLFAVYKKIANSEEYNQEEYQLLATLQNTLLPFHMRKDFCRKNANAWETSSNFSLDDKDPGLEELMVSNQFLCDNQCSLSDCEEKKLLLIRGKEFGQAGYADPSTFALAFISNYLEHDAAILKRIYTVRKKELEEAIYQLSNNCIYNANP